MATTRTTEQGAPTGAPLTDEQIRAQIPQARARGLFAQATEPHAASASYDVATGLLAVELTNGASFAVPVALLPELHDVPDDVLAAVEVGPAGIALSWPAIDVDLSVAGLARLLFGPRAIASAAAGLAGAARSAAKAEAARANGAKGGRPRRAASDRTCAIPTACSQVGALRGRLRDVQRPADPVAAEPTAAPAGRASE